MSRQAPDALAVRVGRLEALVAQLDGRVQLLEAERGGQPAGAVPLPVAAAGEEGQAGLRDADLVATLSLLGRTFVALAGAYLLRALTDGALIPAAAGAAAGMVYAGVWAIAANRAAAASRRASSTFHGAAAVLIAFPLLWEATARFELLSAAWSASALAVLAAGLLWLAWRRALRALGWLVTCAALGTALALAVRTQAITPYAFALILLGIATLWLGYDRGWIGLRWPAAAAANLAVVGTTSRALRPEPLDTAATALALQMLLLTGYLASIAARTLWLGRKVIPFEICQTTAALAVGLGGAIILTRGTGTGSAALGVCSVVIGAATYAVAFAFVDRRQGRGVNFYFYTSLGLVFTLIGTSLLLPPDGRPVAWGLLAIAAAWGSRRFGRAALAAHAAVCVTVMAIAGDVLDATWQGLTGALPSPWPRPDAVTWAVALACGTSLWLAYRPDPQAWAHPARVPRLTLALLLAVSAVGLVLAIAGPLTARLPVSLAPGAAATLRTGVLAGGTLAVAALARRPANVELRWLVYPLLVIAGFKLLGEDFLRCPPSLLVISLLLYGLALIVAPRLARPIAPQGSGASAEARVG